MQHGSDAKAGIRSHSREECDVSGELRVNERDAGHVAVSPAQLGASGALSVSVFDVSDGGLGVRSSVFLPKGCAVDVRVRSPHGAASGVFERAAEVRRVTMSESGPVYELGLAFVGASRGGGDDLEALKSWARMSARGDAAGVEDAA